MKHFLIRWVANYLRRDRDRAEAIIEVTFPGYILRRRRKDAGKKKDWQSRDEQGKKNEGGENAA